jgi:uncharacterized protein
MDFPVEWTALGLAYLLIFVGTVLQGSVGFGLGTFSVPLLLLVDPVFVPGPVLTVSFFLTFFIYRRNRAASSTKEIGWAVLGRLVGTVLAAVLLFYISREETIPVIGGLVLLGVILMASGLHLPLTNRNLVISGSLSGLMGTIGSVGGPALALLYVDRSGSQVRGTISGVFIVGTAISLTFLAIIGRYGWQEVLIAAALFPPALAGFIVSRYSAAYLDRGFIKPAILTLSTFAALAIIVVHVLV